MMEKEQGDDDWCMMPMIGTAEIACFARGCWKVMRINGDEVT